MQPLSTLKQIKKKIDKKDILYYHVFQLRPHSLPFGLSLSFKSGCYIQNDNFGERILVLLPLLVDSLESGICVQRATEKNMFDKMGEIEQFSHYLFPHSNVVNNGN